MILFTGVTALLGGWSLGLKMYWGKKLDVNQ